MIRLTCFSVTFQDFTTFNNVNEDIKCVVPILIRFREHKRNNQWLLSCYSLDTTQRGQAEASPGSDCHSVDSFESCTFPFGCRILKLGHRRTGKSGPAPECLLATLKRGQEPPERTSQPAFGQKVLFWPGVLPCFLNLQSQVSYKQLNHVHTSCIRMFKSVAFGPTLCGELSG